jgi:hypothetical protein
MFVLTDIGKLVMIDIMTLLMGVVVEEDQEFSTAASARQ